MPKSKNVQNGKDASTSTSTPSMEALMARLEAAEKSAKAAEARSAKLEDEMEDNQAKLELAKSRAKETNWMKLMVVLKKKPVIFGADIDAIIGWTAADRGSAVTAAKKLGYVILADKVKTDVSNAQHQFIYCGKMDPEAREAYKVKIAYTASVTKKKVA